MPLCATRRQSRSWLLRGPELVIWLRRFIAWLHSHRDELGPHAASFPGRGQILPVSESSTSSGAVNPASRAMPWTWRTRPRNQRSNGSAEVPKIVNAAARSSASRKTTATSPPGAGWIQTASLMMPARRRGVLAGLLARTGPAGGQRDPDRFGLAGQQGNGESNALHATDCAGGPGGEDIS